VRLPNLYLRTVLLSIVIGPLGLTQPASQPKRQPSIQPSRSVGKLKDSRYAGRRGLGCDAIRNGTAGDDPLVFVVLGPSQQGEGSALTRPRLFWYLSKLLEPDCAPVFTLLCDPVEQSHREVCGGAGELYEVPLPLPSKPGIQTIDLEALSHSSPAPALKPNTLYRWYVSIGRPSDRRSQDLVDHAFIQLGPDAQPGKALWYDRLAASLENDAPEAQATLAGMLADLGLGASTAR